VLGLIIQFVVDLIRGLGSVIRDTPERRAPVLSNVCACVRAPACTHMRMHMYEGAIVRIVLRGGGGVLNKVQ
jgi:hypothetical protein